MLSCRSFLTILLLTSLSAFCLQYFVFAPPSSETGLNSPSVYFNVTKFSSRTMAAQNVRVLLLGGSGAVGQEVIKCLAAEEHVQHATLLLRRELDLTKYMEKDQQTKFTQKIINFDELNGDDFKDFDVCISSLGTTRRASGADGFYKVDHDYVVNTAKLAKAGNCKHFNLVTSAGANKNSWFLYPRTKGEAEEEVSSMGFSRTSIYRPGMLLTTTPRQQPRMLEGVLEGFFKVVDFKRMASVETSTVAKAIVQNSVRPSDTKLEILFNKDIVSIGKEEKK